MGKVLDNTLSLKQACLESRELDCIHKIAQSAISIMLSKPRFMEPVLSLRKQAQDFMEYQRTETMVDRDPAKDRVFPLDTVAIREFTTVHNKTLHSPMIHTGPAADEFARSLNALAVTIARDIYFRNNAYNPADEEGRKLLAHELTHVSQFEEKRITPSITNTELEIEAHKAEQKEIYEPDPLVPIPIDGSTIQIPKSQLSHLVKLVAENVEEWITDQRFLMDEPEYLKLLQVYKKWLEEAI